MAILQSSLARIIGVLVLTAGLAACSAVKLGYNSLPDLAYWWLDGYVDFTETQTPQVRDELARLHLWHRGNELPRIAEMLGRMEQLAPGPVTPAQVCGFVAEARTRLNAVAQQAEPALVGAALALGPRQWQHLERKYRNGNAEWRQEWIEVTPAERAEKRFKQALERAENIYGRLDEPQRNVLKQWVEQSTFDPQRVYAERLRRQQDLLQTLRRLADNPTEGARLVREYVERVQRSPDADYRRYQDQVMEEGCRHSAAVHDSTTPAQREQAVRRLRAYQRDLRELSAQR
jgi:hypothetical protein